MGIRYNIFKKEVPTPSLSPTKIQALDIENSSLVII